jgi:ABC-type nitrate/sulfonate/bicarbonate transport system substrate-binding protein
VRDAATLREEIRRTRHERLLVLGVVFAHSAQNIILRDWLRGAQIDPEKDVRIVVVPPPQLHRNLAAGTLDGYCVGEPWNTVAVRAGEGWCPAWSARLTPGHLEKVLLVRADFARERAAEHLALVAALLEACAWCDVPANREPLARWLAAPRYLDVPVEALLPSLTGRFDAGHGPSEHVPDFHIFSRGSANRPAPEAAATLQAELVAAGLVPREAATADLPRKLFRDDLHHAALTLSPTHATAPTTPARGLPPSEFCPA